MSWSITRGLEVPMLIRTFRGDNIVIPVVLYLSHGGVIILCFLRLSNAALLTAHAHGEGTHGAPPQGQASCFGHCKESQQGVL